MWVKKNTSGGDKRAATLQIMINADGIRRCKPLLIFKGVDGKKNKRIQKEMQSYHAGVSVKWNEKAYSNSQVMCQWLKSSYKYATEGFYDPKRPRLLLLDVFTGHKTDEVRQSLRELKTTVSMIPPGCTGFVQPLDVAINKPLKDMIQEEAELHFDEHMDEWAKGKYSVADRRIMLTHWVGKAWIKFHERHRNTIIRAFRKIGVTLAIDGSEDTELSIKDVPDVEVGDWRLEPQQQEVPLLGETGLVAPLTESPQYIDPNTLETEWMAKALAGEADDGEDGSDSSQDGEYELVTETEYQRDTGVII